MTDHCGRTGECPTTSRGTCGSTCWTIMTSSGRGSETCCPPQGTSTLSAIPGSALHAARAILELEAYVMVLDLQLQDGTGIDVCREVRSAKPSVSGLLLTRQIMAGMDEFHPALTEYDRGIITHVAGGLTNPQVAEQMGVPVERAAADIATLVKRMTHAMSGQGIEPDLAPPGKHRRSGS
jgi:hypothetical protein